MKVSWTTIAPKDAKDISLPNDLVQGPYNENGEECPWPWEPQQLFGAPFGQYHCVFCGAMCVAGIPHLDYGLDAPKKIIEWQTSPCLHENRHWYDAQQLLCYDCDADVTGQFDSESA